LRNRKRIPEGIFTVTLEVTDDMGSQDTYRATMEVGGDEPPGPLPIPDPSTGLIMLGLAAAALIIGSRKGKNTLNTEQSKVF